MSNFSSRSTSKHALRAAASRTTLFLGIALCLSFSPPSFAAVAGARPATKAAKTGSTARGERAHGAGAEAKAPRLSVAQIIQRHLSARGGLHAWRTVRALVLSGKMDAGAGDSIARSEGVVQAASRRGRRELAAGARKEEPKQVQLPFKLASERPNKSRLEIEFAGKTAVQVYDGTNGWKLRPYLDRNDVEPFTPQEAKAEADSAASWVDPLFDSAAKGTKVELAGVERVEGHDAYKLELTAKTGTVKNVWIDARTFLDVKVEGAPRQMDGKLRRVWVYQRDFRSVQGLRIPFVLETVVDGYPQKHKIVLERIAVNPKIDAATFARPKA